MENKKMTQAGSKILQSKLLGGRWLEIALLVFAGIAWSGTAILLARGVVALSKMQELSLGAAGVGGLCALTYLFKSKVAAAAAALTAMFSRVGLVHALVTGITLRIVWVLAVSAQPSSDGRTYLELAQKLMAGDAYQISGTLAYWPPGYAFFLSAFLQAFSPAIAVPVSQISLFIIAALGVYRLTLVLANAPAASLATFIFAMWPNLIAHSATPEKEMLVVAILVWVFVGILAEKRTNLLLTGVLLGAATLVQPSTLLLIPALSILMLMRSNWQAPSRIFLLLLGAALVIAPWSLRNYEVLGDFKLVSSNGGDNLYRANNPLATGGYTERAAVDLSQLGELERDRTAKMLAVKWMRENPADFLALAIEKQIRFMGDDAAGVYASFHAQADSRNIKVYLPLKLMANFWWLFAWLCAVMLIIGGARLGQARVLVWVLIYFFSLHSIFESAGKYHVPLLWVPCVLLGILITDLGCYQYRSSARSDHRYAA